MSGQHEENGWLDPRLRAELGAALPEPPVDEVDWPRLRSELARRAGPRLARLRAGGRVRAAWWEYAARWATRALPAALAAAAALVLLLGRLERPTAGSTSTPASAAAPVALSGSTQSTLEAVIGTGTNESAVLFAAADQDALLRAAVASQ